MAVTGCDTTSDDWIVLRDVALKNGADGAIFLINDGGLSFPSSKMNLLDYPSLEKAVKSLIKPYKQVIVISFSESIPKAEDAALSIAQKLL